MDVGCGCKPRGDVNCDLYIKDELNHRNQGSENRIPVRDIPNFVVCHGSFLPFKTGAFDEVFSAQLIEHVRNPQRFLEELVRVSSDLITVETAHRMGDGFVFKWKDRKWIRQHHISKMNFTYLGKIAWLSGCDVVKKYTITWKWFPNENLPWMRFPWEIGITIRRRGMFWSLFGS